MFTMSLKPGLTEINSERLSDQTLVAMGIKTGTIPVAKNVVIGSPDYGSLALVLEDYANAGWPEERILGMWLAYEGLARVAEFDSKKTTEPEPSYKRVIGHLQQLFR